MKWLLKIWRWFFPAKEEPEKVDPAPAPGPVKPEPEQVFEITYHDGPVEYATMLDADKIVAGNIVDGMGKQHSVFIVRDPLNARGGITEFQWDQVLTEPKTLNIFIGANRTMVYFNIPKGQKTGKIKGVVA